MLSDDTSTSAALGMCLLAFKRADIEDIRSERVDQRRIVDLGAWVSAISAVRPSTPILGAPRLATRAQSPRNLYVAKTVLGCEGGTESTITTS